jgi:hypothetical protein
MRNRIVMGVLAGLAAVGLQLVAAPSAWAGQPDHWSLSDTGEVMVADCGTFEVWDDYVLNAFGIDRYDQDGDIVQSVIHYSGVDRLYSPQTGKSFSGRFAQGATIDWVKGIDWTEYQAVQASHGLYYGITVPGAGVVLLDVGTFVWHLATGDILFVAGPQQVLEDDFTGLCAAFALD